MERKFFDFSLFLILGILIFLYTGNSIGGTILLLVLSLTMVLLIDLKNRDKNLIYSSIFIFLGFFMAFYQGRSSLAGYGDGSYRMLGTIESIRRDGETAKMDLRLEVLESKKLRRPELIALSYEGDREFRLGDRIIYRARLNYPKRNKNPKLFNYKNYLLSRKIHRTSYIKDRDILKLEPSGGLKYKLKSKFREHIDHVLSLGFNKRNKNLIKSIILGENYLIEDYVAKYRKLGLAHILAVSGLHIGLLSSFLYFLLKLLGLGKNLARILILVTIWTYGFLIDFPVSILRANIMISVLFISRLGHEPYDYKNTIYFSLLLILLINPYYIYSLGLLLSFASTLGLAYIKPYIDNKLYRLDGRLGSAIGTVVSVSLALLPIQAYYFNQIQSLNLISNLLVVPIISLSLGLILLVLILGDKVLLLKLVLNQVLNLKFRLIDLLSALPFSSLRVSSPDLGEIMAYYLVLLLIFNAYRIRRLALKFRELARLLVFTSLIYSLALISKLLLVRELNINFVDVGQGDFIHINYGRRNYLIDTGGESLSSFSIGENISLPYLLKNGIFKIDGLFISHFHEDHCRAAQLLLENLDVARVYISHRDRENYLYSNLLEGDSELISLKKGDRLRLGRDLSFKVLSPTREFIEGGYSENDLSLVLALEYAGFKALFPGDMEGRIEKFLLGDPEIQKLDLLKLAHHGSRTSSSPAFLKEARPRICVATVGENNMFKHPDPEVIDRCRSLGSSIYRTDQQGLINIRISGNSFEISPYINPDRPPNYLLVSLGFFQSILILAYINHKLSLPGLEKYI